MKLIDFGLAKLAKSDGMKHTRGVGTPLSSAPEILNNQSYDFPADMWSLGILLFEMLFARNPFLMARNYNELAQHQKEIE